MEDWEIPDHPLEWEGCQPDDHNYDHYVENWPGYRKCADCGRTETWWDLETRKARSAQSSGHSRMGKEA